MSWRKLLTGLLIAAGSLLLVFGGLFVAFAETGMTIALISA